MFRPYLYKIRQQNSDKMRLKKFIFRASLLSLMILGFAPLNASCIFSKPIEAKELEIGNMLSWATLQEVDNKHFVIQRSIDGINYTKLRELKGAGNSIEEKHYHYLDVSTGEQKTFYKVLQVDFNGQIGQTHTLIVDRKAANNFVINSISSALTDRFFTVLLHSEIEDYMNYELVDMTNCVAKTGRVPIFVGNNIVDMDLEGLKDSKYRVLLSMDNEKEALLIKKVPSDSVPKIDYVIKEE